MSISRYFHSRDSACNTSNDLYREDLSRKGEKGWRVLRGFVASLRLCARKHFSSLGGEGQDLITLRASRFKVAGLYAG